MGLLKKPLSIGLYKRIIREADETLNNLTAEGVINSMRSITDYIIDNIGTVSDWRKGKKEKIDTLIIKLNEIKLLLSCNEEEKVIREIYKQITGDDNYSTDIYKIFKEVIINRMPIYYGGEVKNYSIDSYSMFRNHFNNLKLLLDPKKAKLLIEAFLNSKQTQQATHYSSYS